MGRAEKLLGQMEQSPRGWRYDEVARVFRAFGFTMRHKHGGSHRTWHHPNAPPVTVVDKGHGKVPAYQVQQVTAAIRKSMEEA